MKDESAETVFLGVRNAYTDGCFPDSTVEDDKENYYDPLPAHPSKWPQSPVMLRPFSPHTRVRGIRHANTFEYYQKRSDDSGCSILPVNNGGERSPLVIDFETKYFVGTLLLRIRGIPSASNIIENEEEHQPITTNYFDGKKRQFQCVVRGRFKVELPMSKCVTGHQFQRPGGKLTPANKLMASAFLKFVSTLAPQLEVKMDGAPCFLAPLAATAHTVMEYDYGSSCSSSNITTATKDDDSSSNGDNEEERDNDADSNTNEQTNNKWMHSKFYYRGAGNDIATEMKEPLATSVHSILPKVYSRAKCQKLVAASEKKKKSKNHNDNITSRQKTRKKAMNQVSAKKLPEPVFSTNKEYCFEFYQHLLLFHDPNDLAIDMGKHFGQIGISQSLDGQPLNIMSSFRREDNSRQEGEKLEPLWNFELWHKSLYSYAEAYHNNKNNRG